MAPFGLGIPPDLPALSLLTRRSTKPFALFPRQISCPLRSHDAIGSGQDETQAAQGCGRRRWPGTALGVVTKCGYKSPIASQFDTRPMRVVWYAGSAECRATRVEETERKVLAVTPPTRPV